MCHGPRPAGTNEVMIGCGQSGLTAVIHTHGSVNSSGFWNATGSNGGPWVGVVEIPSGIR